MTHRNRALVWVVFILTLALWAVGVATAQPAKAPPPKKPAPPAAPPKVYVPYKELKAVFEKERQGVFLPYADFQRLWAKAQGRPADVIAAPVPYLISTARFTGKVSAKLAVMQLELTVDILADGWVEVPIGLGEVAVSGAAFVGADRGDPKSPPLLRVAGGRYVLITRGKGRRVLKVDFVRQLTTRPGLNVLSYRMPSAAISTLELTIPEENMKVDVEPMLAATTTQQTVANKKVTQLRAFLGAANAVKLSWKPRTQAAAELEPVLICEQFQHIHVAEALIRHEIRLTYDIRRRGVDAFTVQLPAGSRVTTVDGQNISKWDIVPPPAGKPGPKLLQVKLFAPVKDRYVLTVRTERFLKESKIELPLEPVVSRKVLRRTGLIAISRTSRRSVELREAKNLARVDTGRLPAEVRKAGPVTAYRFITADYGGKLAIDTVAPRLTVRQLWALGVDDPGGPGLELRGRLIYRVERAGVFQVKMALPEPWRIVSVGPDKVVDDHQVQGAGPDRRLTILLKAERMDSFTLELVLRADRKAPDEPVNFVLPAADAANLHLYDGQLVLHLAGRFRAEIDQLGQLQALPLNRAEKPISMLADKGGSPAMAFEFRGIDRAKSAFAKFRIAVKPPQISAVVHRLVKIEPGSVQQDAVVQFHVLYAPVDTFYLKMPASLADAGVRIDGKNLKESPRIDALPADQAPAKRLAAGPAPPEKPPAPGAPATRAAEPWAYYRVVLQSPVMGKVELTVTGTMRRFQAGKAGARAVVEVAPILAAGKIANQSGHIAVAKADTLAIDEPDIGGNLTEADPASADDLPYEPHRKVAALAFKYNAPPFALSLPVVTQAEAAVFPTIANAAIVEQVLGRDGRLSARAVFLLATSRGDRLPLTLPEGATLFSVLLDGEEVAFEPGASPQEQIVRLRPSAGQVTHMVLEISYGQDKASPMKLTAPALHTDVPVQQTLWRIWVPDEDLLVWHDRAFSRIGSGTAVRFLAERSRLLAKASGGKAARISFKLQPQGRVWHFSRQGAPGTLRVRLVSREGFHVGTWICVLVVGVVLLKFSGYVRCIVVLLVAFAGAIVGLWHPLVVRAGASWGTAVAAGVVVGLWAAQWLFVRMRRRRRGQIPPRQRPPSEPLPAPLPVEARPEAPPPAAPGPGGAPPPPPGPQPPSAGPGSRPLSPDSEKE